jgi:hypothetical protein
MEEFSVLKTPVYAKYGMNLSRPHYSDGYGYTLAYYAPVYDLDLKIPGRGIAEVPFIPIQHVRASKGTRPFVPRHLTAEDMIQINLRAGQRAKDIMKDFHPSQKATYESARDFRTRKEIESRMEEIRESCASVHDYCRKADKYDFTRKTIYNPKATSRFVDKDNLKDIILDSKFEHIKDMKRTLGEDKNNHRDNFRVRAAGCKAFKKENETAEDQQDSKEDSIVPELPNIESSSTTTARRSSRETRADQLKELQEKIKKQESESDCFERTFGRHLSKLRGEVNDLTNLTDGFIGDTRYKSFKVNEVLRRF